MKYFLDTWPNYAATIWGIHHCNIAWNNWPMNYVGETMYIHHCWPCDGTIMERLCFVGFITFRFHALVLHFQCNHDNWTNASMMPRNVLISVFSLNTRINIWQTNRDCPSCKPCRASALINHTIYSNSKHLYTFFVNTFSRLLLTTMSPWNANFRCSLAKWP